MGLADFMMAFQHMDPATKERLKTVLSEAMRARDIGAFLRDRVGRMIVDDPWAFELLGISPGASPAQVESAYKKLIARIHPDKMGGDDRLFKLAGRARAKVLGE